MSTGRGVIQLIAPTPPRRTRRADFRHLAPQNILLVSSDLTIYNADEVLKRNNHCTVDSEISNPSFNNSP